VNLYAESSAVLAWLLDEDTAAAVRHHLAESELIVASDVTLIECDRVLLRASAAGELTEADAADRRAHLAAAAAHWQTMRIAPEVVERSRLAFPIEPVRTLDAIHLASALLGRAAIAGLQLLSLDERIRRNGRALGFTVLPS